LTSFVGNKQKPTVYDIITHTREDAYIAESRRKHTYRKESWLGYFMANTTDLSDFTNELKTDFESYILPTLDRLQSLDDCVGYYEKYPIWGDMLKRKIDELKAIK
jgi:hypothetical protein